jgi:hypothetical protein
MRANCGLSRRKSIYLAILQFALSNFSWFKCSFDLPSGAPSFRNNPPDKTRSPKPNKTLETALKRAPFLRGLEEENCTSTLFGISTLKRLSRVRQKACPLSREIFKAHKGSIVKIDLFDF